MKNWATTAFICISVCYIGGCRNDYNDIRNITIMVNPLESVDRRTVIINNRDSIRLFMNKLNNKYRKVSKFYIMYTVHINYNNATHVYWGNGNYIADSTGHYEIADTSWNIK